jgi:hypothetical protein
MTWTLNKRRAVDFGQFLFHLHRSPQALTRER